MQEISWMFCVFIFQRAKNITNFVVTNKEHYGMLWYFLEWSIVVFDYAFEIRTSINKDNTFHHQQSVR